MAINARHIVQSPAFTGWSKEISLTGAVGDFNEFLTVTNSDIGIMCLDICLTHSFSNSNNSVKRYFLNKGRRTSAAWETALEFYDITTATDKYALEVNVTATTIRLRVRKTVGTNALTIKAKVNAMTNWETTSFTETATTGTDASVLALFTETPINIAQFRGFTADRILFGATDGTIETTAYLAYNDRTLILRDSLQNICVGTAATGAAITTGAGNLMFGSNAGGNITTGFDNAFIGPNAGLNANGNYQTYMGIDAGRSANGSNHIAIGLHALDNASGLTIGSGITCIGADAGRVVNGANYAVILGAYTGTNLSGQYAVAVGGAGAYSKGANNVLIGQRAGEYAKNQYQICIGANAGRYAPEGTDNIFIGYNHMGTLANSVNAASFLNFDSANVDIANDRITITGHGLTVGQYYTVQFVKDAAGTAPTGLVNNNPYMISVVDANTIQFEVNISAAGTGTAHTLYRFQTWGGLVLIGTNLTATKANQIIIGSTSSDEFLTYAYFKSLSTKANFMPVGTTAQRPSGAVGQYRWNTTTGKPEFHNGTTWIDFIMSDVYSASTSKWTATGANIVNNNAGKVGIVSTGVSFTPSEQLHLKDGNFRVEAGLVAIGSTVSSTIRVGIYEATAGNRALNVSMPDNTTETVRFYYSDGLTYFSINTNTGNKRIEIGNVSQSARVVLNHRTEIISSGNTATDWPITVLDSGSNEVMKLNAVGGMVRTADTQQYQRTARIYGGGGSSTELQARYNAAVIDVNASTNSHIHIEFDVTLTASTHQMCIWLVGVMSGTVADTPGMCDIKTTQSFDNSGLVGVTSSVSAFGHHTHTWYRSSNNKPAIKITNTVGDIGYTQLTLHVLRGAFVASGLSTAPDVAQVVFNTGTNI